MARTTLRDIANECNCSITTVARALKDSKTISRELRDKIQALAIEMGYIPNSIAESMRTGKTNTLAVILQDFRNPFFSIMAKCIEEYATSLGYSSIFITTGYDTSKEISAVKTAISKKVDGVLLFPIQESMEAIEILERANIPFVLVGRNFEQGNQFCVRADDEQGAYLAINYLISLGHRNILFINSFDYISSAKNREGGFFRAMNEHGYLINRRNIFECSTQQGECEKIVRDVFSKSNDYSAVFCYCDIMAFEAIYTLTDMGISVPKDVSVVGVDDIHSNLILPIKITSAGYNKVEMSHKAIDMLMSLMDNPSEKSEIKEIVIEQTLSIGQTT